MSEQASAGSVDGQAVTGSISLVEIIRLLTRRKGLIVLIAALVTLLAVVAAFVITPVYRSQALLAAVSDEQQGGLSGLAGQFGGIAALAGIDLAGAAGTRNEAIALLKSRLITEQMIRDGDLLPVLFPKEWDESRGRWKHSDPDDVPTVWDAYEKFDRHIRTVSENNKTGLITVAIDWSDREQAAEWVANLVGRVNAEMRRRATDEAKSSLRYLNGELEKTSVLEVRQAIYKLIEQQMKRMTLASVRSDYALRVIDPPVVPDADAEVWPDAPLMAAVGMVLGLLLGCLAVITHDYMRRIRLAG